MKRLAPVESASARIDEKIRELADWRGKMTFPKGAALKDPSGLFNSTLGENARRAIDIREGRAGMRSSDRSTFTAASRAGAAAPPEE